MTGFLIFLCTRARRRDVTYLVSKQVDSNSVGCGEVPMALPVRAGLFQGLQKPVKNPPKRPKTAQKSRFWNFSQICRRLMPQRVVITFVSLPRGVSLCQSLFPASLGDSDAQRTTKTTKNAKNTGFPKLTLEL